MADNNDRRNFLKKSALLASGALLGGTNMQANPNPDTSPVKKVKALGFQWETQDPFLFCVHHEDAFPKGNENMGPDTALLRGRQIGQDFIIKDGWRMYHGQTVPGFPGHPHRGFETITVVRKGIVDHTDSTGASGRYGNGDVQWMTAGKGLLHAEMFPLVHADKENPMELFQIWLNLPKKNKMVEPHFKMLWSESLPRFKVKDAAGKTTAIEVIAGNINGHQAPAPPPDSWAAVADNDVAVWHIKMEKGAQFTLPKAKAGVNRTVYFFKGDTLQIADKSIKEYHSADVESNVDVVLTNGDKTGYILVLQGKPIGEPVVQHGPFVMNTRAEIQAAFAEYQRTQFGGWPWPKHEQVHDRNKGRFAYHSDGRKEEKG